MNRSIKRLAVPVAILALWGCGDSSAFDDEDTGSFSQATQVKGDIFAFSAPAVASSAPDRVDVFVQAISSSLFYRTYSPGNAWSAWTDLSSDGKTRVRVDGRPAVVSRTKGTLDVFVRGTDGQLWWRAKSSTKGWGMWSALGGSLSSGPAALSTSWSRMHVFAQGPGNSVLYRRWSQPLPLVGGGWEDWRTLTGGINAAPSATSMTPGRVDLFARGTDNQLWTTKSLDDGATFEASWAPLGGGLSSGTAASTQTSGMSVYVRGNDNRIWAKRFSGLGWTDFTLVDVQTYVADEPAALSVPGKNCDMLFARTPDRRLWHRGCGEVSTVVLEDVEGTKRFERTLPVGHTYAFNQAVLGDLSGRSGHPHLSLDAQWPRELYAFDGNRYTSDPAKAGQTPWVAGGEDIQYASLPARIRPQLPFEPIVDTDWTARPVWMRGRPISSARLVDHGTCNRRVAYADKWDVVGGRRRLTEPGLFGALYTNLLSGFRRVASAMGGEFRLTDLKIEPSFMTPHGSTDVLENDDGFSVLLKVRIIKDAGVCTGNFDMEARASYKAFLQDGALAVAPLGTVYTAAEGDLCYDLGTVASSLNDLFRDATGAEFMHGIPSTGTVRGDLFQAFHTTLPASLRGAAVAASRAPQAFGSCRADRDPAAERMNCFAQGRDNIRFQAKQKLIAKGLPALKAEVRANELANGLVPEAFDCVAVRDASDAGAQCKWHPTASRINVLPDALELVWYDGETPSNDVELVSLFAPAFKMCSDQAPYQTARGPELPYSPY